MLVALVRLVLHADQQLSAAEQDALGRLQHQLGAPRWNAAVQRARAVLTSVDSVEQHAREVSRAGARGAIWRVLVDLAGVDGIARSEEAVLRWVADEWLVDH